MKKLYLLSAFLSIVICSAFVGKTAFAHSTYSECLKESNGRSHIPSVLWACSSGHPDASNPASYYNSSGKYCTLWLGPTYSSTSLEISVTVSSLDEKIDASFYGMCTNGNAGTSYVWAADDNGSIGTINRMSRGTWGNPISGYDTKIDVSKFVDGASKDTSNSSYTIYKRTVRIGRCNTSYTGTFADRYNNFSNDKCSEQYQVVTIRINHPASKFTGTTTASAKKYGSDSTWLTYDSTNKVYRTDSDKAYIKFVHNISRNSDGIDGEVKSSWSTTNSTSKSNRTAGSAASGSVKLQKNTNKDAKNTDWFEVTLNDGDNIFCQSMTYDSKVSASGNSEETKTSSDCVTIHKYYWYSWTGEVNPIISGTSGLKYGGAYYVDGNKANLRFEHKLARSGGKADLQTRFYTGKSDNLDYRFPTQTSWTNSSIGSGTSMQKVYDSPASAVSVDVAKNSGTTYCEYLYWYKLTREDRGLYDYGTDKIKDGTGSATGCVTVKRYKTTFTGTIAVNYKEGTSSSGSWEKIYSAGASEIVEGKTDFREIEVKGSDLPQPVQVQFIHKVTRLGDTPQLDTQKASYFTTSTTGSKGVRNGDTVGNPVTNKSTKLLSKDGYDEYIDTFTVYVYPEQDITLCQTLNYGSELQGTDWAEGRAGTRCFKLTRKRISCMDDEFGIKNAKNYLKMDIYKNGTSATGAKTTGRLESGNTTITMWAKPQDNVRYNYTLCAAADLASQFYYNTSTSYKISTNKSGYLFGTTLSTAAEKYAETSKEVGKTNPKAGVGPFKSGDVYLYMTTIKSPSDDANSLYQCYGSSTFYSDFYQIAGIYPAKEGDSCKSDDYGFSGDVGHIFTQTATWTDLWYDGGDFGKDDKGIVHNGTSNATATGEVRVPYNYKTSVTTSAGGGNIVYGHSSKFNVRLAVNSRKNKQVNNETPYTTYTKETKAELVQIVISPDVSSAKAKEFNDLVNNLEFMPGTDGDKLKDLLAAKIGYGTYTTEKTVAKKVYDAGFNDTILEHELVIPDNESEMAIGTKVCYIAGVWPADSHDKGNDDIDSENQNVALTTTSTLWHISAPSCYTVAKRPSMAIFNADAYAPGGIYGITNKRTNGQSKKEAMFGSWSEYGLVAGIQGSTKGEIKGVASGATLRAGAETNSIPNGTNRICYFSALTFTNTNCEDLGKLPVDTTTASYPSRIASQIVARYTSRNDAEAVQSGNNINILGACSYDQATGTFIPTDGNYKCLNNGTKYVHIKGNAFINTGSSSICVARGTVTANRTIVIDADNTLYVQQNLVYGNANSGVRRTGGCYENEYTTIAEIPQVILIGKKIVIDEDVTHLDAWLIADEISTCNFEGSDVNARNCNKTLTVNGPVITKKLNLLRTAGGDGIKDGYPTNGKSAEIFYLGPETYLWSYNQATRYSQATTTYQRELAPRY